ncbi:MAG: glycoside hydrolase family 127 protein [Clostridia bacterium]|nr:glycoside hydrolase family 127 protein [Clostridia bacterium]
MVKNIVCEADHARVLSWDMDARMKFDGLLSQAVKFIESNQICDVGLWKKCVDVFRWQDDGCGDVWVSWRSEYWGKMMRGASMVVRYTGDDGMYKILERAVRDILTAEDELGRISGYSVEKEFIRWDLWGRKYVMLGMQYFMEICRDEELTAAMIASMRRQADYIIERIGPDKIDIRTCSNDWEGLNSCSILEPIVRLYRLSNEKKYLDFAEYIISTGFIQSANLIELAYADEASPHDYPVVKAYEMMSCFEGLLQYYYVTGIEKYRTAVLNFGRRIIDCELSVIGCSGCTHELFDHTSVRQTQTDYEGIVQETCVTVTWMKLAAALLELSGDSVFADRIEESYYNAYYGAFNTHRVPVSHESYDDLPQVLPFDSYSPLTADRRGRLVGGYNYFPDKTFYGCCACISAAGAGLIPRIAVMRKSGGIVINYYESGMIETKTPLGRPLKITMDTAYPYSGEIRLSFSPARAEVFEIALRIPDWCESADVVVCGKKKEFGAGYARLCGEWQDGDEIVMDLHMGVKRVLPPECAVNRELFAAYKYGPLVLAADKRIADPDEVIDVVCDREGSVEFRKVYCPEIRDACICLELPTTSGSVRLIDYASAGKTWTNESRCAAWLYRKKQ